MPDPRTPGVPAPLLIPEPEARRVLGGLRAKSLFNFRRTGFSRS